MPENKQFYVQIDGQPVEVTEEVYRAFKRPMWAERKRRTVRAEHELSLDAFLEAGFEFPDERADADNLALYDALATLTEDERKIIVDLFFVGKSEREVARDLGLTQNTVNYHKKRILEKLRKILENNF
ncbi:MAG: sigma-70 family RNA polymerase sigma factor [Firmicutes bacterium]|nr:sigma-70 family RNA polymerase sigma factor [Bacillota bacterium]